KYQFIFTRLLGKISIEVREGGVKDGTVSSIIVRPHASIRQMLKNRNIFIKLCFTVGIDFVVLHFGTNTQLFAKLRLRN
ncbi:MAG: hypothetical protein ACOVO2_03380, partial [Emticicia sp.]|uniref:hypothetical protein n=1 Tax=Emticicia sp. TaxID=1930953 RepID=UPI003BA75BFA